MTGSSNYGDQPDQVARATYGDEGSRWEATSGCTFDSNNVVWLAEAAGRRFVGFDFDGRLVDEVKVPPEYLVRGRYFHYRSLLLWIRSWLPSRYGEDDETRFLVIDPDASSAARFRELSLDGPFQLAAGDQAIALRTRRGHTPLVTQTVATAPCSGAAYAGARGGWRARLAGQGRGGG